ncbi:MAG: HD domain-containing protein [Deltaproteobacteria bacterium]|nr:HD domain-containing protein [Deltaproteobacteria bacterium]
MKWTDPAKAKRRKSEERSKWDMRDAFSIDVDRILHSRAYTSYIDKTQVFYLIGHQGISHRVIHVQLLSRIARTIGRKLGLNDDLIEAIAIGHDIGHPPFGHDGEIYLDGICQQTNIGLFRHNVQAVQALEIVEKDGKGLNLTLEVLDGILCHNGEMTEQSIAPDLIHAFDDFDEKLQHCRQGQSPAPATMEGCLVRVVDTISYVGRDIEDAIALGIISRADLPQKIVNILGDTNGKIVYTLVEDLIQHSGHDAISYSQRIFQALSELKAFNYENIYLNEKVKKESDKIKAMYALIFASLADAIESDDQNSPIFTQFLVHMTPEYEEHHIPSEIVRDFIASLTDSAFLRLFYTLYVPQVPS